MAFELRSSAFLPGDEIPPRHGCEGEDASPPLSWSGVPEGTQSFALIVEDPDAPDPAAPKRTFCHWVVYDIPVAATGFDEDATRGDLPSGCVEGLNDFGNVGWNGPCPPIGRHRYFFKLFALDRRVSIAPKPGRRELAEAIRGHVLGTAELMGTYQKRVARAREAEPRPDVE